MPRMLRLDDDAITIEFSGLLLLGTLHRRVRFPYEAVRSVRVEPFPQRHAAHGRFVRRRRRLFLSFDNPRCVVRIELRHKGYDEAVIGVDNPREFAAALRRRVSPAPALAA